MRKRILTLLLALAMTVGLLPAAAFAAEEDHNHDDVTFIEWTNTGTLPTASGNYYLTTGVTLTDTWTVPANADIKLCLNGHTITQTNTSARVVTVNGSLTVYDCIGDGEITGGNVNNSIGGGVYVAGHASFTMKGGSITGNQAADGYSNANGGGVAVEDGAVFIMNGGEISGNFAESYSGGGVAFYDTTGGPVVISLSGRCRIIDNTCNYSGGEIETDLDLGGGKIKVTGSLAGARIGVMSSFGRFTTDWNEHMNDADNSVFFYNDDKYHQKGIMKTDDGELTFCHIVIFDLNYEGAPELPEQLILNGEIISVLPPPNPPGMSITSAAGTRMRNVRISGTLTVIR